MKEFLDALEHPLKRELMTVRKAILAVSPDVTEGVKWNAPSFRLDDDFATFHLRGPGLTLVLHSGARSKLKLAPLIDDADEILEWRGADRALVTFASAAEVKQKLPALTRMLRAWIAAIGVASKSAPQRVVASTHALRPAGRARRRPGRRAGRTPDERS